MMDTWLWTLKMSLLPLVISLAALAAGLYGLYLGTKLFLILTGRNKGQNAIRWFGYLWMGMLGVITGFLISELGYQFNFWKAPGIWGAPGKEGTVWKTLEFILPPLGFVIGVFLNVVGEKFVPQRAQGLRIGITIWVALVFAVTLIYSSYNAWQTLG